VRLRGLGRSTAILQAQKFKIKRALQIRMTETYQRPISAEVFVYAQPCRCRRQATTACGDVT
jgi:hypothetical protein